VERDGRTVLASIGVELDTKTVEQAVEILEDTTNNGVDTTKDTTKDVGDEAGVCDRSGVCAASQESGSESG
jgi:hypothetical protein